MKGSSAQNARTNGSDSAQSTGRGLFGWKLGGYQMKPAEEKGRIPMNTRRSGTEKAEIRLGTLQVVVWLGLSLGCIFGAYGLGFVSGKSVGFESARSSSATEVARLTVSEPLPERAAERNPSGIYDRLNAPAVLEQEPAPAKQDAKSGSKVKPVLDATAEKVRQIQEQQPVEDAPSSKDAADTAGSSLAQLEEMLGSEDAAVVAAPEAKNVRMLGADAGKAEQPAAKEKDVAPTQKTVGSLLDERLGAVSQGEAQGAYEEQGTGKVIGAVAASTSETKAPAAKAKEPAPASRIAITKKLQKGYYAQVQAPQSADEAEGIASKLRDSGFPVAIEAAAKNGQTYYRVMVGPEQKKVQADRLLGQLKGEKYIKGTPFIRAVE